MPGMTVAVKTKKLDRTVSGTSGQSSRYHHIATDTGEGHIIDEAGIVDYVTGSFTLPVLPAITESVWNSETNTETWQTSTSGSTNHAFTSGVVTCYYTPAAASDSDISMDFPAPPVVIQLVTAGIDSVIVQGSVLFSAGSYRYFDRAGYMYRVTNGDMTTLESAGTIDYSAGSVSIESGKISLSGEVTILTLLTKYGDWSAVSANFRTQLTPLKPEALSVTAVTEDGVQISASADENGDIVGEWISGEVNYSNGIALMEFGKMVGGIWEPRRVDPATIRYNAVSYKYIPLSAGILGIDAVRLPSDGRVPIYRSGDLVVIANTDETAPATKTTGQTINAGRTRLAWVRVIDSENKTISSEKYELNRATGSVTITDDSGIAQPIILRHTVADLRMVTDAQINGSLTLSRAISFDFDTEKTIVAGCLLHGDRRARVSNTWDQNTWDGTWKDSISGSPATATLDFIAYPIVVTNEGCETERWVLRWISSTNVELIGETRGLVFSGAFNTDISPINPRTRDEDGLNGVPFLTIPVAANGGGWSAGNVVRINTVGAIAPIWMARSVMQSEEPLGDGADGCEIYALGNVDRP